MPDDDNANGARNGSAGGDAAPRGELAVRTLAMPADANPAGDIFGGWIMSQMDIAGGMAASQLARGRVVTVAVTDMTFHRPVQVGDIVCCYTEPVHRGRTSLRLHVEAWVLRQRQAGRFKVTQAEFTFVAIDAAGRPRAWQATDQTLA
ncbi:acyl-CoA thioesterase [Roseomonas sp. NAR14]|uniref:Acyl-CoA thioesterase n=1 Tax=Roseomonas acroporae TaxID=2937791 RepID=A0A9X1YFV7_9PROT|nr:acyl-CoA thioesterase [Roseomonas acroporae]MCK8785461.1 acyl-CoA thioesterase [Roseomonas acroporae]